MSTSLPALSALAVPALPALSLPSLSDVAQVPGQVTEAVGNAGAAVVSPAVNAGSKLIFGLALSNVVLILIGLLLIAAGIFSFDKTKEVLVSGGKKAAALAAA